MEMLTVSSHAHGVFTVVTLAGELDLSTAPLVEQKVLSSSESHPHLVFDMSGITFMDSIGVRVMVKAHAHVRKFGGTIALAGLTGNPLRVLTITGLHTRLALFVTLDEALTTAPATPNATPDVV
ncbi:MAG: hypothetical protein QOE54_3122 [Streptosporangiaceae bacterium]|nr:sle [Streptosporangiaceae bacterium]MDX6430756.1 hypothetical protein [Streptosporangiaceae bacterium]